jgi:hypothetical protein
VQPTLTRTAAAAALLMVEKQIMHHSSMAFEDQAKQLS